MTDEFRDCFVGEKGYDTLKKLMRSGNEFCQDVAKCLQERIDAEIAYGKSLRKNSDAYQKLAGRAKGTLALAFTTLATQTSKESDAHSVIAGTLLNDISMPMKNLAEAQLKDRKSIEDTLNGKFKEWNAKKETDNKFRTRQFEKSKEIETLILKISELSSTTKSSSKSKGSSVSTPLVMSCILPGGRHNSASEKSTSNSDVKYHTNLESSIKKVEEELEKVEKKYHTSTRDVELLRQACDVEMCRSCDKMQKMELDRITEMGNYIRTYTNSIQTLSETMHQITQDLYSIKVLPSNDIISQTRSIDQPAELDILLYDIYAENKDNVMSEQRRILSLMRWMEILKRDIEIQQQTKNANKEKLSASSQKIIEEESPSDDRGSSSDGAMRSRSQKDIVLNSVRHQDGSSSSSNDDDGAMHHTKREKKKKDVREGFTSELFIDRHGAALLEELYKASLFKIESTYNSIKRLPEPRYALEQRFTRTYNDKGYPITILRIPAQSSAYTPPSAPSITEHFVQAMPIFLPPAVQEQPMQRQAPPVGWAVNDARVGRSAPVSNAPPQYFIYPSNANRYERTAQPVATYPVLMAAAAPPPPSAYKHVRVLYNYEAKHEDELSIKPGEIILLLERRDDGWCKGNFHDNIGLFPGNYVEDC